MRNVIIAVLGILITVSVFVVIKNSQNTKKPISPASPPAVEKPATNGDFATYTDPSGFVFQYPKGIVASAKKLPNNQIYSSVELSATGSAETITIKAEDSNLNTIDDWFKGSKKASVFGEIKKVKLADLDARQFAANNERMTIALDQGVLFTITTNAKKDTNLLKAYQKVTDSFVFVQPNQPSDSSDVVDEGEEVVE